MGLLRRFIAWMSSPNTPSERKGHPDLHPINVDKLVRELRLVDEAHKYGAAGLPAPDAVDYSSPEKQAIQRIEKARQDYVQWADTRLSVIGQQIARRSITDDVNRARQADQEFGRRASKVLSESDTLLRTAGVAATRRRQELEEFRAKHGLTREAHYPTDSQKRLNWAVVIGVVVVEAFVNAGFFAQGLDSGLVGGFVYAAGLAALNVGVAFALGCGPVRYVAHRELALKILGWVALLAAIALMLSVGLGISHYREWLSAEGAGPPVLEGLLTDTLGLKDLSSWALLAVSVFFASLALFEGWRMDDPYPGYGAVSKRAVEAAEEFQEELDSVREELEDLKDEELGRLDAAVQKTKSLVADFEGLIDSKRNTATRLELAMEDASYAIAALLQKFQDENELARGKAPRPAYFNTRPNLKELKVPNFAVEPDEALLAEHKELVRLLLDEVETIRARIQEAFHHQFDKVKPLGNHYQVEGAA